MESANARSSADSRLLTPARRLEIRVAWTTPICNWLAGLLEGEGTFVAGPPSAPTVPLIRLVMTDGDIVQRAAGLIGRSVQHHPPREQHHRPSMSTTIKGAAAVCI